MNLTRPFHFNNALPEITQQQVHSERLDSTGAKLFQVILKKTTKIVNLQCIHQKTILVIGMQLL